MVSLWDFGVGTYVDDFFNRNCFGGLESKVSEENVGKFEWKGDGFYGIWKFKRYSKLKEWRKAKEMIDSSISII